MAPSFAEQSGSFRHFVGTTNADSTNCSRSTLEFCKLLNCIVFVSLVGDAFPELSFAYLAGRETDWYFSWYFDHYLYLLRDFFMSLCFNAVQIMILLLTSSNPLLRKSNPSLITIYLVWLVTSTGLSMIFARFRSPLTNNTSDSILINVDVFDIIWFCLLPSFVVLTCYACLVMLDFLGCNCRSVQVCFSRFCQKDVFHDSEQTAADIQQNASIEIIENPPKQQGATNSSMTIVTIHSSVKTDNEVNAEAPVEIDDLTGGRQHIPAIVFDVTMFVVLWIAHIFGYLFTNLDADFISDNYSTSFLIFSIVTSILKRISKMLAKNIDRIRIHEFDQAKKESQHEESGNGLWNVSAEYFIEFYFTLLYYLCTKYWVSTNAPESATDLLLVICLNVFQEIFETNFVFSDLYFNLHQKMMEKNRFCALILTVCKDIKVWRERCAMDIVLRFIAEVMSTMYYIVLFLVLGQTFVNKYLYGTTNKAAYLKSILYTIIYGGIDVVHFVVTIIFNRYKYNFDTFEPTILVWHRLPSSSIFWCVVLIIATFVTLQFFYY